MLVCSDASFRSKNVNQEIRLAWKYDVPYLPLLLEQVSFSEQVEYWLEGSQWIDVLDRPPPCWLPAVCSALELVNVRRESADVTEPAAEPAVKPVRLEPGLQGLLMAARFTDQIWPVPAEAVETAARRGMTRGLGAPQPQVCHGFRLGSRVRLIIEAEQKGHVLLLDEGPEGTVYCLCPSWFAPETELPVGQNVFPRTHSRYDSFRVTGQPGREHLLAIVTDEPLGLNWMSSYPNVPAKVLSPTEINELMQRVRGLEADRWRGLSTYFDVV